MIAAVVPLRTIPGTLLIIFLATSLVTPNNCSISLGPETVPPFILKALIIGITVKASRAPAFNPVNKACIGSGVEVVPAICFCSDAASPVLIKEEGI